MPEVYDLKDPCDLACSYFDCGIKEVDAELRKLTEDLSNGVKREVDSKLAELADKVAELKNSGYYENLDPEEWAKKLSEELAKFND